MPRATSRDSTDTAKDSPVYWFAMLSLALSNGDFDAAAEANRHLARLGVRVTIGHAAKEVAGAR